MGAYSLSSTSTLSLPYSGVQNGPVEVTSSVNVFTSERALKGPYDSFNEVMGFPNNQLTNDYWFPWYDDVNMTTWVLVGNPSSSATAHVTIQIAGSPVGGSPFAIPPLSKITPTFSGIVNGPVEVSSDLNVFTSERTIKGPYNSFNEVMGFPNNQLTNDYWFPWYDDVNMTTWVLVGNPSALNTAHVTIKIAGTSYGPYTIGPLDMITPTFAGVLNGPVEVSSDLNVFTSERVIKGPYGMFNEVMGYPNNQLTSDYWFPWYDDVNMTTWVLVGNPSGSATAHVTIKLGGAPVAGSPYSIPPLGKITPTFPGVVNGPVEVTSDINVFTSERVTQGPYNSFNEVMGYPANQLTNDYWFPWYDDVNMSTLLMVGRP